MSELMTVTLSGAALAVIGERNRQVEHKGYTHEQDDAYTGGQLAQAAAIYAGLADRPLCRSTAWPWAAQAGYKPSPSRRRNLVKAGALILAEIERLERAPLLPVPVQRDKEGWWSHPDFLDEFDDEISTGVYEAWCARKGIETSVTHMEGDVSDEVFEQYMSDGQCDASAWEITPHPGHGWFIVSIHDTEEGPVCVWARPVQRAA